MTKMDQQTKTFIREALSLALSRGESDKDAARSVKGACGSVSTSAGLPETPEQEIKRLRMEIERLRAEREILMQAATFFASDTLGLRQHGRRRRRAH